MGIVALEREGYVPEKLLNVFAVPLTLGQVHAALSYTTITRTRSNPPLRNRSEARENPSGNEPSS
jgi:hypothetical protein